MKTLIRSLIVTSLLASISIANAGPEQDKESFQGYFTEKFPDVTLADFGDGVYALNNDAKEQWQALNDFPLYEDSLEEGEELFNTAFANGKGYADCFPNGGVNIKQNYPIFDTERNTVVTIELAINECRTSNGEKPLPYKKGDIAKISAYMTSTSVGSNINVVIPDNENALAAYEEGKQYYYTKRGQLNFSCANCHVQNAGRRVRADTLSPALGHTSHFPVYRLKWKSLGTLHRRFGGCNKQVRAQPLAAQSEEYKNLEYYLAYMSNGLPVNGPATRK